MCGQRTEYGYEGRGWCLCRWRLANGRLANVSADVQYLQLLPPTRDGQAPWATSNAISVTRERRGQWSVKTRPDPPEIRPTGRVYVLSTCTRAPWPFHVEVALSRDRDH